MSFHCVRCHAEIDRSFKACPHCGEPVTDFLREYADKPVDGKYRILERLGTGGMGEVYKVEHTFLGAVRVIKVIRGQIAGSDDAHDRFLREARLATKVQHTNVATLHDFSALPDGSHYMVWEFIEGENLAQVLRFRGNLPPRYAVSLIRQALAGLEAIHRAGIIHRDISPENLMLTRAENGEERIKIIDLGVAKGEESDQSMTKTGMFVGKLRYCSPEHLGFLPEGERIDGRADLYSLAIVLYEMLAGRAPFEATSPHQYILHHSREEQLRSVDLDGVPGSKELQAILARALERDRNKRYANAREFGEALAAVEKTLPDPGPLEALPPVDGEPTLRLTSPASGISDAAFQSTIRTDPGATARARLPIAATQAAPTRAAQRTDVSSFTPRPAPPPVAPPPPAAPLAPSSSRSLAPMIGAAVIILGLLAVIGYLVLRRPDREPAGSGAPSQPSVVAPGGGGRPSQTTFDVAATSPPPAVMQTSTTPTTSVVELAPPTTSTNDPSASATTHDRVPVAAVAARPTAHPVPVQRPQETGTAVSYTEGGDSSANEAATAAVQPQLRGTTRLSIDGSDAEQIKLLTDALKNEGVTVADGAEVAIHFEGTVAHRGMGRKRRSAEATVSKGGRVLLHYTMPAEDYRVGDTPAEAFARVLGEMLR